MPRFEACLSTCPLVLTEAAVIEALRRDPAVDLDAALENALLVYSPSGRRALQRIYGGFIALARHFAVPLLLGTPTWRANAERVQRAGAPETLLADATALLRELQADAGSGFTERIFVAGLMACKGDCYRPDQGLSPSEARRFHAWQAERLSAAGVDVLLAATLPAVGEAEGMAACMAATETPYLLSFVIDRRGRILDGTPLAEAIARLDNRLADRPPLGYMVNCSHPTFFTPEAMPEAALARLIGFQANASSMPHDALDGSDRIRMDDVDDWCRRMARLNRRFGISILGGCCGTDLRHLRGMLVRLTAPKKLRSTTRKSEPQSRRI
jgi:homocysteine S-methyltransferase